ncbi:MAG TPA: Sua5/YciO/YrdC/YwlC family protein [Pseudomonadales bacterium]|nr:Sua5/YciO/YrdC/YwlC family protein [Pseudomonadales bacterium]
MIHFKIQQAANIVRDGGVVAYPTEAVWGLGCDPYDASAVQRILDLKQRPMEKGLILIAADIGMCYPLLSHLTDEQRRMISGQYDRPTTWLIPDAGHVPVWVKGEHQSFALRITRHPWAAALSKAFGGPVVSTSANPAGKTEARTRLQLANYFPAGVDYVAPGNVGSAGKPSQIRDLITGAILR